jgi:hypothetical protein
MMPMLARVTDEGPAFGVVCVVLIEADNLKWGEK